MGLAIRVYKNVKKLDATDAIDEDGDLNEEKYEGVFQVFNMEAFKERASDLIDNGIYVGDYINHSNLRSYTGYNAWRDAMAVILGFKDAEDLWDSNYRGEFWELLQFADNEGTLGPAVCGRLWESFKSHQGIFVEGTINRRIYDIFLKAFTNTSDNGVVIFC